MASPQKSNALRRRPIHPRGRRPLRVTRHSNRLRQNSQRRPTNGPTKGSNSRPPKASSSNQRRDPSAVEQDTHDLELSSSTSSPPAQDLGLLFLDHRPPLPGNIMPDDDDGCQPDSQELMPPPVFHRGETLGRQSRLESRDEEDADPLQNRKRRNTRSSSRSTVILSDEENEAVKERLANYLKRSPSKQLKRSDDFGLSTPSRASSRSTVIFSSSSESL